MLSVILYDVSVFAILVSGIHPLIYMLGMFVVTVVWLKTELEYCAIVGAVFFAAILHKKTQRVSQSFFKLALLGIYLYVAHYINFYVAFLAQLFVDYYTFKSTTVYQQKTYNRFLVLLAIVVWNGGADADMAILLSITVGHGAYLNFIK